MSFYARTAIATTLLAALSGSNTLHAANESESTLKGSLEFGYNQTSGNTDESTLIVKFDQEYLSGPWRNALHIDAINSESDGVRSAEKYFISDRQRYRFTERNYVFGYGSYNDDRFSGFEWEATVSAGLGRRLFENDTMYWDFESGPGYRKSKVADDAIGEDDQEEAILRVFTKYHWDFSETASFDQEITSEGGEDNVISKWVSSVSSKLTGALALKVSYTVKYTQVVPDDTKHADTELAVTLVLSY